MENLADTLGFNKSYAVSSSGRSGGLGIFWNDEIKVEVVGYSKYHIDTLIDELVESQVRITFVYGEAQVPERYKTWDMIRGIAVSHANHGLLLEILMRYYMVMNTME